MLAAVCLLSACSGSEAVSEAVTAAEATAKSFQRKKLLYLTAAVR